MFISKVSGFPCFQWFETSVTHLVELFPTKMHFEEKLDYWLSCCHLSQACPLRFQLWRSVTTWRLNMTHNFLVKPDRLQMQNELSACMLMKIFSFTDKFGCFCACNNCLHSTSSAAKYGVDQHLAESFSPLSSLPPNLATASSTISYQVLHFLPRTRSAEVSLTARWDLPPAGLCLHFHTLSLQIPLDAYKPLTGNQSWSVLNFSSCLLRPVLG